MPAKQHCEDEAGVLGTSEGASQWAIEGLRGEGVDGIYFLEQKTWQEDRATFRKSRGMETCPVGAWRKGMPLMWAMRCGIRSWGHRSVLDFRVESCVLPTERLWELQ